MTTDNTAMPRLPQAGFVLIGTVLTDMFVRQVNIWPAPGGEGYLLALTQINRHTAKTPGGGLFYAVDRTISEDMVASQIVAFGQFDRWRLQPIDTQAACEELTDCRSATGWRPPEPACAATAPSYFGQTTGRIH